MWLSSFIKSLIKNSVNFFEIKLLDIKLYKTTLGIQITNHWLIILDLFLQTETTLPIAYDTISSPSYHASSLEFLVLETLRENRKHDFLSTCARGFA